MAGRRWIVAAATAVCMVAAGCTYAYGPFIARVDGPVVIEGSDMPDVVALGLDPGRALAYRWDDGAAAWVQIPVQIDERFVVDYGAQPDNNNDPGTVGTVYGTTAIGVTELQYADPGTWVGADPDTTFDADDELVLLARDAGPQAPGGTPAPPQTVGGIGKELTITDPTNGGVGYVYLFYGQSGVDPSAGVDHVTYDFDLATGPYLTSYNRADGPNPETSSVTTDNYTVGFGDRWITDEWRSAWGSGVDILDGHKNRFNFSTCNRSNVTFSGIATSSTAEGAFVANIDGPIRAIRSYVGANSGPRAQQTLIFYEDRFEIITDLRVHGGLPGMMDFFDFSAAAVGMSYGNSEMGGTVTIDGSPDTVPGALPDWEYVAGPQGYVSWTSGIETSIPWAPLDNFADTLHVDDDTPPVSECWGDGDFLGAVGVDIPQLFPNTDPGLGSHDTFRGHRVVAFWPTGLDPAVWTPLWAATVLDPVGVAIADV